MFGPVCALMVWDKFFVDTIGVNKKNSKNAGTSNFSKRYPYHKPINPSLRGYKVMFESLVFCIGIGMKKEVSHECLLRCGGAFVWTICVQIQTLQKLGACREKQMRFLLQIMEFFYSILMGRDAIWDTSRFNQYFGPLGGARGWRLSA